MRKIFGVICVLLLILNPSVSNGQGIIRHDTVIKKILAVNDTFTLDFLDWPSPGICWSLYSEYDTSQVSIRKTLVRLLEGKQIGGKYAVTMLFKGLKPGQVDLEYYWGRPWLKEKQYQCLIEILITPDAPKDN